MRALEFLNHLNALDDEGNLTALGEIMAEFPLDLKVSTATLQAKYDVNLASAAH